MSVVAHARWTGEPLAEMLHDQFMNLWVRILRGQGGLSHFLVLVLLQPFPQQRQRQLLPMQIRLSVAACHHVSGWTRLPAANPSKVQVCLLVLSN